MMIKIKLLTIITFFRSLRNSEFLTSSKQLIEITLFFNNGFSLEPSGHKRK